MAKNRLSPSDRAAVDRLRTEVKDQLTPYYDTDFNLLRWLVGHDYDIDAIKPKLLNHLLLRKYPEWDLDNMAKSPRCHPVHEHWKEGMTGPAVNTPNTIVTIEQSGSTDFWGLMATFPGNEMLRARVQDLEIMLSEVMKMEAATGERWSILFVMDLTDLKLDRRLMGGLESISSFMAENYVEMIHTFVAVNVPSFMQALWTIVKPLLPEKTRKKVRLLGSNWKEEILEMADPSVLPSYWNTEKEKIFTAHINRAQQIPTTLHYKGNMPEHSQKMYIKKGKTDYIEDFVREGQTMSYELHADGGFAFAVFYSSDRDKDGEDTTKWEKKIPGPTIVPIKDKTRCQKTGYYRCWISNEHAWVHTLKIVYIFDIMN